MNGMFVRRTWTVRLAICVSSEDGPTRGRRRKTWSTTVGPPKRSRLQPLARFDPGQRRGRFSE